MLRKARGTLIWIPFVHLEWLDAGGSHADNHLFDLTTISSAYEVERGSSLERSAPLVESSRSCTTGKTWVSEMLPVY